MFKPSLVRRYFSTVASKKLADVLIVLGGPGAGKGTQCENLVERFGFRHLSAGQLLRDEMKKDNEESKIIDKCIKEGQIVPSSITVRLLLNSINQDPTKRYLIDGFPRNDENLQSWEKTSQDKINLLGVLFIECSLETMTKRIEGRAKTSGRTDDNMESLKKRFRIFESETLPVIEYYEKKNKVIRANGNKDIKSVSEEIQRKVEQVL